MNSAVIKEIGLKEDLINKLISLGYTKMLDGRQLYELSISELKETYELEKQIEEHLQYQLISGNER